MSFEKFSFEQRQGPEHLEILKDRLFDEYMKQQIMEDFFFDLADYFEESEIDVFREVLSEYDDISISAVISLPKELRQKNFEKLFDEYEQGEALDVVVNKFVERLGRYDFGIGYHTSPYDIQPDEAGVWQIAGTEADHRDDDRMMAYYSTKYRHLYKKRHPKFIYAVRSSLGDDSHKTDGNWNRADALSVITKVPFEDVVQYVESTASASAVKEKELTKEG